MITAVVVIKEVNMSPVNGLYFFGPADKRPVDTEWEEAMNKDEKPCYYRVYGYSGDIQIKQYRPSIAELMSKRTGKKMVKIG